MKILFNLGHPAHVHLFKHLMWDLSNKGHEIKITARDKEILLDLLDYYGFTYTILSNAGKNLIGIGVEMLIRDYRLFKIAKNYSPYIMIAVLDPPITHVGKLLKIPSITFTDTEHAKLANIMTLPFTNAICTPSCFKKNLGKKQIHYDGYHEIAYLHPNYFTPNPTVLDELGLTEDDTFVILRFVSWNASHDVGHSGIQNKIELVQKLEKYGRVLITSEGKLSDGLEKYQIKVSPEKMHDLLYYATLLYGESATMASECAVLGTHSIYCDFAGRGYTDEEEEKYGLVFNFKLDEDSIKSSLEKAVELLEVNNLKSIGRNKRDELLKDKIDVTAFMVDFIENYPESSKKTVDKD